MTTLNLDFALGTARENPKRKVEIKHKWGEMNRAWYANTINEELNQYNISKLDPNNVFITLQYDIASATLDSTQKCYTQTEP